MKRIGVLTSGGDSPGMNAAIRAVVRRGISLGFEVYGIYRGYSGLIMGEIQKLDLGSVGDIIHKGGTILNTSRSELFKTEGGQRQAIVQLKEYGIEGLIIIGGDGSSKGAKKLFEQGISTIVIPSTIDNDMTGTEMTLGFDTAVNTVVSAIDKIRDTASSHERVYVIEVMGRQSGSIAIWAGLSAGSESIIIPEIEFNIDEITNKLMKTYKRGKRYSTVIVAEGISYANNIAQMIKEKTKFDTRVTILGHIQRGGSPTSYDRVLGSRWGSYAAELLLNNACIGKVLGLRNNQIVATAFEELFNRKKANFEDLYHINNSISI